MPSPTCQVKDGAGSYQATTNGVNVTPANTVTINLVSSAGVSTWSISCIGTDELSSAATVSAALVIDPVAKTATFTAPIAGRAYIFQSQVNSGVDANGIAQSSYTTTFGVYTLTAASRRTHAVNETFEGDPTFGWISSYNDMIRNPSALSTPTGTGLWHVVGGSSVSPASLAVNADVDPAAAIALTKLAAGGTNEQVVKQAAGALALGSINLASSVAVGVSKLPPVNGGTGQDMSASSGLVKVAAGTFSAITAPAGAVVGTSDSQTLSNKTLDATCSIVAALDLSPAVDPNANGLRLTLTTGVPVLTSDVATATTIFLTPYTSGVLALYISSKWALKSTAEISLAIGTLTSGKNYDVFAFWTGSVVGLELSAAWSSDTARTDAIGTQDGVQVKSADHSRRLVGTIRTISTTQTTDTATQRFVWNGPERSRQVDRFMLTTDTTDTWTYGTSSFRQARATASNKVEYVTGATDTILTSHVYGLFASTSTGLGVAVGVGIDSTTVNSAKRMGGIATAVSTGISPTEAFYDGYPGLGYHAVNWLEFGHATVTFYGDNGAVLNQLQSGISAKIAA